nr:STAS domain-containing protein [uncultured Duganella sp.]
MRIPILRLGGILLSSIQFELSDVDAMQFQNDLVNKIAELEANGVVIDVTSLDVVDSFMARVLNDTASMARLLGAEVVLCGVQPYVAMTLVELGRDLLGADCTFNLDQAVALLKTRIAGRGDAALAAEGGGADDDPY